MEDLAVIQTGGKQYVVSKNDVIEIEIIKGLKESDKIEFDEVLLTRKGDKVEIGKPFLKNAKVSATVIDQIKGDKINILKFKAKSRYRKRIGHRQNYLKVKIEQF
jgi:large subunit ribosomal protein L21